MKSRTHALALVLLSITLPGCRDEGREWEETAIPVKVVEATRGTFAPKLQLYGTVQPGRMYPLTTGPGGTIRYASRFSMGLRTGERVTRGEEVGWIENEDARLALVEARLSEELATTELARQRTSFEQGLVPRVDLERAELQLRLASEKLNAAEARAERRSVRVPDDGVLVVDRVVAPGSEVQAGVELARVALEGRPRVESVAAAAAGEYLHPGLVARIRGRSGAFVEGRVVEVSHVVDEAGTLRVVAEPVVEDGLPAPGEGVELVVELDPLGDVVTVPGEALVFGSTEEAAVFVVDAIRVGEGLARARRVDVVVAGRSDGIVAVSSGLTSGELVVTAGAAMLGERSLVKVSRQEEEQ